MLRIRYPKNFSESKEYDVQSYIRTCNIDIYKLKGILKNNINKPKCNVVREKLLKHNILNTTFTKTISVDRICDQYINQLRCTYDVTSGYCYYYIPNTIRCVGTNSCLLDVIRLIEYGNNYVPPMNWVRHSYLEFVDYIEGKGNK